MMKFYKKLSPSTLDKLLEALAIIGVCVILFVGGMIAHHYKLPPSALMTRAVTAGEAWYHALKDAAKRTQTLQSATVVDDNNVHDTGKIISGEVTWNKSMAYEGYTLLSYRFATAVQLLDMEGNIVYRWNVPFEKIWPEPSHIHSKVKANIFVETAHLFPNGDLLVQYSGIGDTPYGYGIAKVDKDANVIWKYSENAHHDFYVDEEGYIYGLIHKLVFDPLPGLEDLSYPMFVDYIVKLTPEGKEIDRISILEAFHESPFSLLLYHKQTQAHGAWDEFHTNTIRKLEPSMAGKFPMFKSGSLLISMRNMNGIAIIDPDTRKVSWAYQGDWRWQHGVRFLDNGNLLILDNLGHYVGKKNYSKVVEFNPQTLRTAWYVAGGPKLPLHTTAYGRTQRLPNGNTLVSFAFYKHVLEFTPDKRIVWDYKIINTSRRNIVQAISNAERYAADSLPFLKNAPPSVLTEDPVK